MTLVMLAAGATVVVVVVEAKLVVLVTTSEPGTVPVVVVVMMVATGFVVAGGLVEAAQRHGRLEKQKGINSFFLLVDLLTKAKRSTNHWEADETKI